jgi:hypothetical protein
VQKKNIVEITLNIVSPGEILESILSSGMILINIIEREVCDAIHFYGQ